MNKRTAAAIQSTWIPAKERKWVFLILGLTIAFVGFGLWNMAHYPVYDWHNRQFKEYFKSYGSIARILLFGVLSYYVLMIIMKKRLLDRLGLLKKIGIMLLKITRKWHTPLAIAAIGLIALHIVGAFLYGLKMDFTNISGLAAGLVLIGVPIAGIFRYRKLDRKWHLKLGIVFSILFLLHAFL